MKNNKGTGAYISQVGQPRSRRALVTKNRRNGDHKQKSADSNNIDQTMIIFHPVLNDKQAFSQDLNRGCPKCAVGVAKMNNLQDNI